MHARDVIDIIGHRRQRMRPDRDRRDQDQQQADADLTPGEIHDPVGQRRFAAEETYFRVSRETCRTCRVAALPTAFIFRLRYAPSTSIAPYCPLALTTTLRPPSRPHCDSSVPPCQRAFSPGYPRCETRAIMSSMMPYSISRSCGRDSRCSASGTSVRVAQPPVRKPARAGRAGAVPPYLPGPAGCGRAGLGRTACDRKMMPPFFNERLRYGVSGWVVVRGQDGVSLLHHLALRHGRKRLPHQLFGEIPGRRDQHQSFSRSAVCGRVWASLRNSSKAIWPPVLEPTRICGPLVQ